MYVSYEMRKKCNAKPKHGEAAENEQAKAEIPGNDWESEAF